MTADISTQTCQTAYVCSKSSGLPPNKENWQIINFTVLKNFWSKQFVFVFLVKRLFDIHKLYINDSLEVNELRTVLIRCNV